MCGYLLLIQAGLDAASLVQKAFGQLIRDTCSQAARVGVDLSFEQRRDKCMLARIALQAGYVLVYIMGWRRIWSSAV